MQIDKAETKPSNIIKHRKKPTFWHPSRIILFFFGGLILVGAILLWLPFATVSGQSPTPLTALFTSTSAVCVTGLVLVDTGSYWSGFGQVVILLLMELGGLGFASSSVFFMMLLGGRISLTDRTILKSAMGRATNFSVIRLAFFILGVTLGFQAVGAGLLFLGWIGEHGPAKAAWWGVFHSVAAFANSGFDLAGTTEKPFVSLTSYKTNYLINLTISLLIIFGGLGFVVIAELLEYPKRRKFSLHSRVILLASLTLLVLGTIFIWLGERDNPATLGNLSLPEQLLAAFFQSASPRTAGFNSVDLLGLHPSSLLLIITLMFIGGSSGSTAGGLKVGTLVVVFASIRSILLGQANTVLYKRTIPARTVEQALAVGALYTFGIGLFTMLISLFDDVPLTSIVFEVVSAFCTVGLSLGITPGLSLTSHLLLIIAMFAGRLGPVLLVLALSDARQGRTRIKYAEEDIGVG